MKGRTFCSVPLTLSLLKMIQEIKFIQVYPLISLKSDVVVGVNCKLIFRENDVLVCDYMSEDGEFSSMCYDDFKRQLEGE